MKEEIEQTQDRHFVYCFKISESVNFNNFCLPFEMALSFVAKQTHFQKRWSQFVHRIKVEASDFFRLVDWDFKKMNFFFRWEFQFINFHSQTQTVKKWNQSQSCEQISRI